MLGKCFCCRLLCFRTTKRFGPRSGLTKCQSWTRFKLLAKVFSWWQRSLLLKSWFCCRLLTFFKIKKLFLKKSFGTTKLFQSRSGPTFCRSWSGCKLFAKIFSRWQKSLLAMKEVNHAFVVCWLFSKSTFQNHQTTCPSWSRSKQFAKVFSRWQSRC